MSSLPNHKLKTFIDIAPLVIFFMCFKYYDIFTATAVLMGLSIISTIYLYYMERKIPWVPLITTIFIVLLGGMTILFKDESFIKIKLTVVNGILAAILLAGYLKGKGLLKYVFGAAMNMPDTAWRQFSLRWAVFFIFLAILNEIIWRSYSTPIWVNYKAFGVLGLTFLFMISQYPFLKKYIHEPRTE